MFFKRIDGTIFEAISVMSGVVVETGDVGWEVGCIVNQRSFIDPEFYTPINYKSDNFKSLYDRLKGS